MSEHPRGQPRQPQHGAKATPESPTNANEKTSPHGVPNEVAEHEPAAYPTGDRLQSEAAATKR